MLSNEPKEANAMAKNRAKEILRILRNNFTLPSWTRSSRNLFQTLIRTVLSQATTDKNTHRAFRNLSTRFPITPKALAKADVREIEKTIRVAGLYKNKSKVIKYNVCKKELVNACMDYFDVVFVCFNIKKSTSKHTSSEFHEILKKTINATSKNYTHNVDLLLFSSLLKLNSSSLI